MLRRILRRVYAFLMVFTLAAAIAGAQEPSDCPDGAHDSLRTRLSTEVDSMLAPWNRPGLLSNIEQFDREVPASKIARLYLRDQVALPKTVTLSRDRLAAYAGRYALGAGADYEVTEQHGALWLTVPSGERYRLAALSRDRFVYEGAEDVNITFTRGRDGQIRGSRGTSSWLNSRTA